MPMINRNGKIIPHRPPRVEINWFRGLASSYGKAVQMANRFQAEGHRTNIEGTPAWDPIRYYVKIWKKPEHRRV